MEQPNIPKAFNLTGRCSSLSPPMTGLMTHLILDQLIRSALFLDKDDQLQ